MIRFFKQNRLLQALSFSSICCVFLVIFRVWWSGKLMFIFLPLNLVLAWLPLLFALYLPKEKTRFTFKVVFLLSIWLLFFPNAPYVFTDLIHLKIRPGIPFWFDILLLTAFAWNGLVIGFLSLLEVQRFLLRNLKPAYCWQLVSGVLILSSFGIYLGRFQRWNSWDIVLQPVALLRDIAEKLFHPFSNPTAVGVTFFFSVFLLAAYLTFYHIAKPNGYSTVEW